MADEGTRQRKGGLIRVKARAFLIAVAWFSGLCAMASDVLQDTIIVDGQAIQVESEVVFDTLRQRNSRQTAFTLTAGPAIMWRSMPASFERFSGVSDVVSRSVGTMAGGGSDVVAEIGWRLDVAAPVVAGAVRPIFSFDAIQSAKVVGLEGITAGDSIVGWLSGGPGSVQAVTWERYPIGIETDTLTFAVEAPWRFALSAGAVGSWSVGARENAEIRLGAGALWRLRPAAWDIQRLGRVEVPRSDAAQETLTPAPRLSPFLVLTFVQGATLSPWRRRPSPRDTFADRVGWQMDVRFWSGGWAASAGIALKW